MQSTRAGDLVRCWFEMQYCFHSQLLPPRELPTAMAERSRERSRSMIQRLLVSYIRRKRVAPSEPIDPPPSTVPTATEPCDSGPPNLPPAYPQESDGQHSHDLDVTMAESTVTFGNTMCLNDLNGGLLLRLHAPLVYLFQRS